MNEKKIALWALIITFFGWVGIKPEHFKSVVFTIWDIISTGVSWLWELIKMAFDLMSDVLTFSMHTPISIIIIISGISFLFGRTDFNKLLAQSTVNKASGEDIDSEPLSDLSERQRLVLLDIYKDSDQYRNYDQLIRHLRIDTHMLDQAMDQLVVLGYLVVQTGYRGNYPKVSRHGRDTVIQYLEG